MLSNSDWVPPGESVRVQDFDIPGGMVYVGSTESEHSACQIDPALEIRISKDKGFNVRQVYYSYGYPDITPEARGAYLTWLAAGKSAPGANIGNVFLYFYGLERRVLLEMQTPESLAEIPLIKGELQRLLGIYGDNGSFRGYATSLLEFLDARTLVEAPRPDSPLEHQRNGEIPFGLKVGVAKYVMEKLPLPGDWAFAWWRAHPGTCLRTTAERCPEVFRRLFIELYHQTHGEGLLITATKVRLKAEYKSINPSFNGRVFDVEFELPDVTLNSGPMRKFKSISESCYQSLDRYSRYLGRNPDKADTIEAFKELPILLLPEPLRQPLLEICERVFGSGDTLAIQFKPLRSLLPVWQRITKSSNDEFLERLLNMPTTEPVSVRPTSAGFQGFIIPDRPKEKLTQMLDLDFAKVSALEADSQHVSEILQAIFHVGSQDFISVHEQVEETQTDKNLWGLSDEFSDFLRRIATRPEWSRTELEELAKTHSLMLDGALEHINEAALDRCDLPLTEGDDPVEINQELIKEFTS